MGCKDGTKILKALGVSVLRKRLQELGVLRVVVDAPGLIHKFYFSFKKNHGTDLLNMSVEERCLLFTEHIARLIDGLSEWLIMWFTIPGCSHHSKLSEQDKRAATTAKQRSLLKHYTELCGAIKTQLCVAQAETKADATDATAPDVPDATAVDLLHAIHDALGSDEHGDLDATAPMVPTVQSLSDGLDMIKAKREQQFCNTQGEDFKDYLNAAFVWLIDNQYVVFTPDGREDEIYAAYLTKLGRFDAVLSEDFDVICMNPGLVIRSVQVNGWCEVIDTKDVFDAVGSKWGLNEEQFLDYILMCGNDFAKLPGFGPATALTYIQHFGNIDNMIAVPDECVAKALAKADASGKKFDYQSARAQFSTFDCTGCDVESAVLDVRLHWMRRMVGR